MGSGSGSEGSDVATAGSARIGGRLHVRARADAMPCRATSSAIAAIGAR